MSKRNSEEVNRSEVKRPKPVPLGYEALDRFYGFKGEFTNARIKKVLQADFDLPEGDFDYKELLEEAEGWNIACMESFRDYIENGIAGDIDDDHARATIAIIENYGVTLTTLKTAPYYEKVIERVMSLDEEYDDATARSFFNGENFKTCSGSKDWNAHEILNAVAEVVEEARDEE